MNCCFKTNTTMKLRMTIFAACAATLMAAHAQTLTIPTGGNDAAVILEQGSFNVNGSFIGGTGGNTKIQVAEVDFGAGDVYKAVSIRYANGWDNGGKAILSAGDDIASAVPFASIDLINWGSYTNFRSIGANFSAVPTGVKKVFLTFEGRAGNIMDVRLYNDEFTAEQFESGSMLKEPCDWPGYAQLATVLSIDNSELVYSSSSDTRPDNGSWGWTGEGVVVRYGNLDFGAGDYKQVVLEVASHWQGDQQDHSVDVYIDDYNDEANLIANVWCGIDIPSGKINYLARNIEAISGTHTVYLKWHGGSINVADVHFVKDRLYSLGNVYYPIAELLAEEQESTEPSANAARYTFRNALSGENIVNVGRDSGRTRILTHFNNEQWEDNNVGYTCDRTMLRVSGVNFKSAEFDRMICSYATGANWSEATNFQFFLDTEVNKINLSKVLSDANIQLEGIAQILFNLVTSSASVDALLAEYDIPQIIGMVGESNGPALVTALFNQIKNLTPVATVAMKPTGDWGKETAQIGSLASVTGTHNVYVLYNAHGGDGANLKDFWLSTYTPVNPIETATLAEIKAGGAAGEQYIVPDGTLTCVTTWSDGNDLLLLCKDAGGAVQQLPGAGQVDYMGDYVEMPASLYDQSNWIVLRTSEKTARMFTGHTLRNIRGQLAGSTAQMTLAALPLAGETGELYVPNTYIPSSFYGTQTSARTGQTYFFVTPQPGEYAAVKWAVWNGEQFVAPANDAMLEGGFAADFGLMGQTPSLTTDVAYQMRGIVVDADAASAVTRRAPTQAGYVMRVVSIAEDEQVLTGITDLSQPTSQDPQPYYDLTGRRVMNPAPGIYIMGGKKVLVK